MVALLSHAYNVHPLKSANIEPVEKIEMKLSAFGVESDGFPNITAIIDLKNDTSFCDVSYYDPKFPAKTYRLTPKDMGKIRQLMAESDIRNLERKHAVSMVDQPNSIVIFHLANDSITVSDYGLTGQFPLKELYELVYKPEINFR